MQRAAQLLIRLIATGLIVVGGLMTVLEFLAHRAKQADVSWFKLGVYGLVFVAGIMLFAISRSLAAGLTDGAVDAEDEDEPAEE